MPIKAYFFNEASDVFFVDNLGSKFKGIEEVYKIGLVRKSNPTVNDLMCKVLRRGLIESHIFQRAMELYDYNPDKQSFTYKT